MTLKPFWEGFRGDGFRRDIAHNWISVVRERERERRIVWESFVIGFREYRYQKGRGYNMSWSIQGV